MIAGDLVGIDTNILISSVISKRGNEARVMSLVRAERIRPAVSPEVLLEYESVLRRAKFGFDIADIEEVLSTMLRYGKLVEPRNRLFVSPHEPDNRLLECAEAAGAAYLITGNLRHFPAIHGVTRIVNARTFLEVFEATS